jgi:hypothetical protein
MADVKVKKPESYGPLKRYNYNRFQQKKEIRRRSLMEDATTSRALFSTALTANRPIGTTPPYGISPPMQAELMTTEDT